jgi:hypothetical protein
LYAELSGAPEDIDEVVYHPVYTENNPRFMWIAARGSRELDQDFHQRNSRALWRHLEDALSDSDLQNRDLGVDFLDEDHTTKDGDGYIEPFEQNGFRILQSRPGYRPMEYGKELPCFRVGNGIDPEGLRIGTLFENAYEGYLGAYMILVVHYQKKTEPGKWVMSPVAVTLKKSEDDGILKAVADAYDAFQKNNASVKTQFDNGNKVLINIISGHGMAYTPASLTQDAMFTAWANGYYNWAPFFALKFDANDFKYLTPRGLYGVTNYTLYLDAEISNENTLGYRVHLNGTPPAAVSVGGNAAVQGYIFQFDPSGAMGFSIRAVGQAANTNFGVRPMYFYDAAKADDSQLAAPKAIDFFTSTAPDDTATLPENFNSNVGANEGDNIYYRTPFLANANYKDTILWSFFRASDRRDFGIVDASSQYGQRGDPSSAYSHKLIQSWHKYPGLTAAGVKPMGNDSVTLVSDDRVGFRWDGSWAMEWDYRKKRHILKLTILELTQNVTANQTDGWGDTSLTAKGNVHDAGDLFVRAEVIMLKPGASNFKNPRNYVYSKPMWFGKFKGDFWRGDDLSPFKKMGNRMEHIVSAPEPKGGDAQSYRRRGMRLRSWKDSFEGWGFTTPDPVTYRYVWSGDLSGHTRQYPGYLARQNPEDATPADILLLGKPVDWDSPNIDKNVWTPPIAVKLDAGDIDDGAFDGNIKNIPQNGSTAANTFGQYADGQFAQREKRANVFAYNGNYTPRLYGRLNLLRNQGNPNPLYGLYALWGWDYGYSGTTNNSVTYDSAYITSSLPQDLAQKEKSLKRFLMVLQGLQLPYQPVYFNVQEELANSAIPTPLGDRGTFYADRPRVTGISVWGNGNVQDAFRLHDIWLGEGFAPWEVREILGVKDGVTDDILLDLYQSDGNGGVLPG